MMLPTAQLAYGRGRLPLDLDENIAEWHLLQPKFEPALADPHAAFVQACAHPYAAPPLRDIAGPGKRIVIVTSDGTRPVPNRLLIPWILEMLACDPAQVTVLIGTGSHRPATLDEISTMFGAMTQQVSILNHDAYDPTSLIKVGVIDDGAPVWLNRHYVDADVRILLGFIEPHFFAGFSGGPKAVVPGVAGLETIQYVHRYALIASPNSVWGCLDDNPLHQTISRAVALCPPHFLINVALNSEKAITAAFAGDCHTAHRAGCAHVKAHATLDVDRDFPLVVTSNSGYPLDQNLYQSVKGLSAAARIVASGGEILMASACSDGIPDHGRFGAYLRKGLSLEAIESELKARTTTELDQWQVQILCQVLRRARVGLYSTLDPAIVRACGIVPIPDLQQALHDRLARLGRVPVAVMPEGPLTIPCRV